MRHVPALLIVLGLVAQAAAKADPVAAPNTPQPRQGGDTVETAVPIPNLPFTSSGTTTGYTDDYDEVCPYDGSTSPDVVYAYNAGDMSLPCEHVEIDLYGSTYDTKLYLYDSQLQLVACNDDYYPNYVSKLESVPIVENQTYYVVIDGYGGDHGDYQLSIYQYAPCYVVCPPGFTPEDELLQDGVVDTFNSGCDVDPANPRVVPLPVADDGTSDFCGTQGWTTVDGAVQNDTDWFSLHVGPTGTIEGEYWANLQSLVQVYTPGDCDGIALLQTHDVGPCLGVEFAIEGTPGQEFWLRVATLGDPACGGITPQGWDYTLQLSGMQQTVANRARSWSSVKSMFGVEMR